MIIVLGHVTVRPEPFDEVLRLSLQRVERSRAEPGCIAHAVHRDAEPAMLEIHEATGGGLAV